MVVRSGLLACLGLISGCRCDAPAPEKRPVVASANAVPAPAPPRTLYLPDGEAPLEVMPAPARLPTVVAGRCPAEMVDVQGAFCIDRFELQLVDASSGQALSPFYHPTRGQALKTFEYWEQESKRMGPAWARAMPLPDLPLWQREREVQPRAAAHSGVIPSGYLNADIAALACERAGKRLCSEQEWVTACKGEAGHKYPYGPDYEQGACNVFRDSHPARLLHHDPSLGHLDPRLNQVQEEGGAELLRASGALARCRSQWGSDAVYDMVGNLDEWVDDAGGKFLGGFYARATKEGCDASVSAHPRSYFDYSLGARCCR